MGGVVIPVLLGSVRSERVGGRVAKWVLSELRRRGHEAVLVDPAPLKLPLLDTMWKEIKDSQKTEHQELRGKLKPLADLYARADGFAIVTAEYNHAPPPALTNLIDYFLDEYAFRPSAIVCYSAGPFGGVRAAMQLRAMLAETGMSSIPTLQPVQSAGSALSEDGLPLTQTLAERSGGFFSEFEWYMRALKAEREKGSGHR